MYMWTISSPTFYFRFPLTTVEEEPTADLGGSFSHQFRATVSQKQGKYGQRRISTPQVANLTLGQLWMAQQNK